jgi:hypothetical protein
LLPCLFGFELVGSPCSVAVLRDLDEFSFTVGHKNALSLFQLGFSGAGPLGVAHEMLGPSVSSFSSPVSSSPAKTKEDDISEAKQPSDRGETR